MTSNRNVRANAQKKKPKNLGPTTAPKQEQLIRLLRRPSGATMATLIATTGWQPHTIRATISTVLRKRLGLIVSSVQNKQGVRSYKIGKR